MVEYRKFSNYSKSYGINVVKKRSKIISDYRENNGTQKIWITQINRILYNGMWGPINDISKCKRRWVNCHLGEHKKGENETYLHVSYNFIEESIMS